MFTTKTAGILLVLALSLLLTGCKFFERLFCHNDPPVAVAGADQTAALGELVTLDGTGSSDPDGDSLSYSWSFDSVPAGSGMVDLSIQGAGEGSASFTPDVAGAYVVSLSVSDGVESVSDTIELNVVPGMLPAPHITAVTADSQATVSWNDAAGASSYNLYYRAGSTVTVTNGTRIDGVTSPRVVTGLTNGVTYAFIVTSVYSAGESVASNIATATPEAAVSIPAAPTITATPGNRKVTVTWTAVAGATSYNVYWAAGGTVTVLSGTEITGAASPRVIAPLTNGVQCAFVVTALNSLGESEASAVVTATPAAPPSSPSITAATPGNGEVTVTWDDVAGATSYNIYYRSGTTVTKANGTKIVGVPSSHSVTGLVNGVPYAFVATAQNAIGEGLASTVATAIPIGPAPAPRVSATAGDGEVTVSWPTVSGATSYNLYWKQGSTVTTGDMQVAGASSPSAISGLTNGLPYSFIVTSVNAQGEGPASGVVTSTPNTPPAAPAISATPGDEKVTVSWGAVTGATSFVLCYRVGASVSTTDNRTAGVSSPWDVTALSNGTTYSFIVIARTGTVEGAPSNTETTTPVGPPAVPTITSVGPGDSRVAVNWSLVGGATSYNLYYKVGSTVTVATGTPITEALPGHAVTGLANGVQYAFAVTSESGAGVSAASAVVVATPNVPLPLDTPTGLAVVASCAATTVSWDTVNGPVCYVLYRSTSIPAGTLFERVYEGMGTSYFDAPLAPLTTYYYRVSSYNAYGQSTLSDPVSGTTLASPADQGGYLYGIQ